MQTHRGAALTKQKKVFEATTPAGERETKEKWQDGEKREAERKQKEDESSSAAFPHLQISFFFLFFFFFHCRCSSQMRLRVLDKRLFDNLTHGRTIRPSTIYMQSSLLAARRCHATHAGNIARRCRSGKWRRGGGDAASSHLSTVSLITCFFLFFCFFSRGGSRGI